MFFMSSFKWVVSVIQSFLWSFIARFFSFHFFFFFSILPVLFCNPYLPDHCDHCDPWKTCLLGMIAIKEKHHKHISEHATVNSQFTTHNEKSLSIATQRTVFSWTIFQPLQQSSGNCTISSMFLLNRVLKLILFSSLV